MRGRYRYTPCPHLSSFLKNVFYFPPWPLLVTPHCWICLLLLLSTRWSVGELIAWNSSPSTLLRWSHPLCGFNCPPSMDLSLIYIFRPLSSQVPDPYLLSLWHVPYCLMDIPSWTCSQPNSWWPLHSLPAARQCPCLLVSTNGNSGVSVLTPLLQSLYLIYAQVPLALIVSPNYNVSLSVLLPLAWSISVNFWVSSLLLTLSVLNPAARVSQLRWVIITSLFCSEPSDASYITQGES